VLEALKALQYEGPKSEAAQNFKEQGNECVQVKKWSDAKEFYTKGLAVLHSKEEGKWDQPDDPIEEEKKRKLLSEQLYANRARCNLELSTSPSVARLLRLTESRELSFHHSGLRCRPHYEPKQCQGILSVCVSTVGP